jgi:hypothetical protein
MTHHYEDREHMSDIHSDADDRERARERDRIAAEKRKEKEEDEAQQERLLVPEGLRGARPVPSSGRPYVSVECSDKDFLRIVEDRALEMGVPPTKLYATLKLRVLQVEVDELKRTLASNG